MPTDRVLMFRELREIVATLQAVPVEPVEPPSDQPFRIALCKRRKELMEIITEELTP